MPVPAIAAKAINSGLLLAAAAISAWAGPGASGFFVTADGYFATRYRLVVDAEPVVIRDVEGRTLPARIVAVDPGNDLALLKAEGNFAALPLAPSATLKPGDRVFAVKSGTGEGPGAAWILVEGAVSGVAGNGGAPGALRVTISPGPRDSGAPLLDADGAAVGVIAPGQAVMPKPEGSGALPGDGGYAIPSEFLLALIRTEQAAAAQLPPRGAGLPGNRAGEPERALAMVLPGQPEPATAAQPDHGELLVAEMFRIGNRARLDQDYPSARTWLLGAATRGHAPAQAALADLYRDGQGGSEDAAEAVRWYRAAALQGEPEAQARLGWMYARGTGIARDDDEALGWFRRAAEEGNAAGQNALGVMYRDGQGVYRDDASAADWFRRAALQGDPAAQDNLGVMFRDGRGVEADAVEAAWWFRKAAEQGDAEGQTHLGLLYREGRGVQRDEAEAVKWFRRAAEQGDALGEYYLGVSYNEGRGVPGNRVDAAAWLTKSAGQGHSLARDYLREIDK